MAKKKSIKKQAKKIWVQNVEALELDMLRDENAALKKCLRIYEEWYAIPQTTLRELIKTARSI